ncbi:MAG: Holliday junction resolvase RuvX [Oscillospiraceae bacterium]|nr:Holliday junction resolvase RuvX [Oscillospiraceae bacterium]
MDWKECDRTMRVMAIDYGDARIGIAVSDALCSICGEAFTLHERDMARAAVRIAAEVQARNVGTLVLGLPRNMDGSEGPRAALSREFAALLKTETGLDAVLWDERRSSIEAHAILRDNGRKTKQHRKNVDAVAASLLLEGYLGRLR